MNRLKDEVGTYVKKSFRRDSFEEGRSGDSGGYHPLFGNECIEEGNTAREVR